MKNSSMPDSLGTKRMHVTRFFQAPIELVFSMWTHPGYLARWWGPREFNSAVGELNATPGGSISIVMQGPDNLRIELKGQFQEVISPRKLVFSTYKVDEQGRPELEALHTVLLSEEDGKTRLDMHVVIINLTPASLDLCQEMEIGWEQSFDKMDKYLRS